MNDVLKRIGSTRGSSPRLRVAHSFQQNGFNRISKNVIFSLTLVASSYNFADATYPAQIVDISNGSLNQVASEQNEASDGSTAGQPDTKASKPLAVDSKNLKSGVLGSSFEKFRPSEEISADNAVPFPVDI